jgi:5-methyltetrahydrofolate--homocysteine methyltransferase
VHTAVKIASATTQAGQAVYVTDASRAVGVVSTCSRRRASGRCRRSKPSTRRSRRHAKADKQRTAGARARQRRQDRLGTLRHAAADASSARASSRSYDLAANCARYIDWTPFFQSWELAGRYPRILDDAVVGAQARELFADAQAMLQQIVDEDWLQARGVVGLWPAHSNGDDIIVLDEQSKPRTTLHCLRQQVDKPAERPDFCLADFIAPQASGRADWIGAFAVTTGHGCEARAKAFEAAHDDYRAILLKALADRLAEAFAEYLHAKVRRELWAYAKDEPLDNDALIREQYQGIRPAPGYPACPDHSTKRIIFDLLDAPERCGMQLTESLAMTPAASVSGLYFSHPRSQYFVLGRVSLEQVEDYAKRRDISRQEAERWLATVLDYDPE